MFETMTEKEAEEYIAAKRWPNGVRCPRCESDKVTRGAQPGRKRQVWTCYQCKSQFSVTSGTIMDATKMPLVNWLRAAELLKAGSSGRQMAIAIGMKVDSAWHLKKRLQSAIASGDAIFGDGATVATPLRLYAPRSGDAPSLFRNKADVKMADMKYDLRGAMLTVAELAIVSGRSEAAIRAALRGGRSAEEACFGRIVTCEPGDKFGLLTVLSRTSPRGGRYRVCECAGCGTVKDVAADKLKSGEAKTCGRKGCRGRGAGQ